MNFIKKRIINLYYYWPYPSRTIHVAESRALLDKIKMKMMSEEKVCAWTSMDIQARIGNLTCYGFSSTSSSSPSPCRFLCSRKDSENSQQNGELLIL